MLKNDYLVAKIGVDPAENEPSKVADGRLRPVGRAARGALVDKTGFGSSREALSSENLVVEIGIDTAQKLLQEATPAIFFLEDTLWITD